VILLTLLSTVTAVNDAPIVDNDVILQQKTINGRRDLTDAGDIDPDGTSLVVTTTPVEVDQQTEQSLSTLTERMCTHKSKLFGTDVITVQVCDSGTPGVAVLIKH
jgi:hypothetical protein